ncbi:hypothetical protein OSTOST_14629 [Ostertagia ostertagi]
MADGKMSDVLSPTAKALSRAAVIAHNERDEGCVRAILSALWNLASHSERNKRAICDEPGFLALLISLLSNDARMTAVVESASGILKYVSQYLSTNSSHLSVRPELAAHLVQLLSSASFTIVANTLGALANLIAKDPHLQSLVRHDVMGMNQLNVLRNSAREDIRAAVKAVLNHLNQPVGYTRYTEMSTSMGCESMCSPRDSRLLALRGVRMSPGAGMGYCASPSYPDHRSSSLPRHFTRGGYTGPAQKSRPQSFAVRPPVSSGPAYGFAPPPGQYHGHLIDEVVPVQPSVVPDEITGDPDLSDSVRCTRSVSAASLGSELPNASIGWQSCLDTAANSNRMSPVSPSDLPDSPTQCAKMVVTKGDTSTPLSVSVRGGSGAASSSEPQSGLTASDTATAIVDDQPTPTFPAFVLNPQLPASKLVSPKHGENTGAAFPVSSLDDGLYAMIDVNCADGNDLLTRSIEAELPQPSPRSATPKLRKGYSRHFKRLADERLLADMIESAQPSPRKSRHGPGDTHHSPNVLPLITQIQIRRHVILRKVVPAIIRTCDTESMEKPDITLPLDCFIEEDNITIDCSRISFSSHDHSSTTGVVSSTQSTPVKAANRSARTHKTRLPKPTHGRTSSVQKINRTIAELTPKKEAKSAVVPPYNYRRPESDSGVHETEIKKQSSKAVNPGQMLVTTV